MTIRIASREDVPLILQLIKDFASYEKLLNEVVATKEILEKSLFDNHATEVIIGEVKDKPMAFALFFTNFQLF
jgi:N-acetylglutamate synthase-like GNAT family acetyltransferase